MPPIHILRAIKGILAREFFRFIQQRGRLLSAIVRPLLWLMVFGTGFRNILGIAIMPPYETYIPYPIYIIPGLIGMILLFNGMQSSLSMVYDREMGVMRLLMTAPLPRWFLLIGKMLAGTTVSIIQVYVFLFICLIADYRIPLLGALLALPAMILVGFMVCAMGLFLSSYFNQLENFAGIMNFVIFPMFFLSSSLYPLWRVLEGSEIMYYLALANPFTHAVELIRFAIYGKINWIGLAVVVGSLIVFLQLGIYGYSPQKGMAKRAIAN